MGHKYKQTNKPWRKSESKFSKRVLNNVYGILKNK